MVDKQFGGVAFELVASKYKFLDTTRHEVSKDGQIEPWHDTLEGRGYGRAHNCCQCIVEREHVPFGRFADVLVLECHR